MKNKNILVLTVIALIVVLFISIMIIKLKQTNKNDITSASKNGISNEINYTEENTEKKESIVAENKIEKQNIQEEKVVIDENIQSKETKEQTTTITQDKKVNSPKQTEQPKTTETIIEQKTQEQKQSKQNNKTETQTQDQTSMKVKSDEKQSETPKCTNEKHAVGVGNSNRWFDSKQEAINHYQSIIKTWGDKWEKFEIDDETYQKNCPYGYEIWSCPLCEKWTKNFYYN